MLGDPDRLSWTHLRHPAKAGIQVQHVADRGSRFGGNDGVGVGEHDHPHAASAKVVMVMVWLCRSL